MTIVPNQTRTLNISLSVYDHCSKSANTQKIVKNVSKNFEKNNPAQTIYF